MYGSLCGDIVGSIYEGHNIKNKDFPLFSYNNRFTDDSVMTAAISKAAINYFNTSDLIEFENDCINFMQELGRSHIHAGYGGNFIYWILSPCPKPYNSFGNGSAMRVSSVAWVANSLEEAEKLAEISASVTHNHPDGIAGAKAVAGSIWLLLNGGKKSDIKKYVENNYYNLGFTLDSIRESYTFDVSCKGSVPHAIVAFLESESFEDAIKNAISIGGDSDTIAAICGGLSEAYYGISNDLKASVDKYLDDDLLSCVNNFYSTILKNKSK